ncbi:hypothetical protein [Rhodothermus bifroesti]|uniref:hypothetical protein n=1 Tax=Rhodothermus bifroesti TaxID=2823335 RepID=UPI0039EC2652
MAAWLTPALELPRHEASMLGKTKGQATSPSPTSAPGSDNAPRCGGIASGGESGIERRTEKRQAHLLHVGCPVLSTRSPELILNCYAPQEYSSLHAKGTRIPHREPSGARRAVGRMR